MREKVAEIKV